MAKRSERKRLKPNTSTPIESEGIEDLDEAEEVIPFTYSITSYGADYPVESLVRRMKTKDILVPIFGQQVRKSEITGFQREYVWQRPKADKFIESLLLGLPVPGIFLVKEPSGVFLVLDGHQRLHTLRCFYEGKIGGQEYSLQDVQERFIGKGYEELDVEDRRRLDDSIIHATIIRQDEPREDQSSVYIVFERLNTGGVNLQPQEIRVALYHGEFARVLRKLNEDEGWRSLCGPKSRRLKDLELILRFFAMYYCANQYEKPMKGFLNRYMASNRSLRRQDEDELRSLFQSTVNVIVEGLGKRAFRPVRAVNAAVVDSVMTAIAIRLSRGPLKNPKKLKPSYERLMRNSAYRAAVETATADETNVARRLELAQAAFEKVK